jgi:hypothetical protein
MAAEKSLFKRFYHVCLGKLQTNKTYSPNILVQITVKKLTLFSIHWMQEGLFFSKKS